MRSLPGPGLATTRTRVTDVVITGQLAFPESRLRGLLQLNSGDRFDFGRWQDTPAPAAALPPAASVPAVTPSTAAPTTEAPTPTVYRTLQAEAADELTGVQAQDTSDQDGGQNVGFIASGDSMRFDNFDFGPVPATKVDVRVASDAEGGQMDVRLDDRVP